MGGFVIFSLFIFIALDGRHLSVSLFLEAMAALAELCKVFLVAYDHVCLQIDDV